MATGKRSARGGREQLDGARKRARSAGGELSASGPARLMFADLVGGGRYPWDRSTLLARGLYVRLDGGRAHLFEVGDVS